MRMELPFRDALRIRTGPDQKGPSRRVSGDGRDMRSDVTGTGSYAKAAVFSMKAGFPFMGTLLTLVDLNDALDGKVILVDYGMVKSERVHAIRGP
jgi:hypothetical protein